MSCGNSSFALSSDCRQRVAHDIHARRYIEFQDFFRSLHVTAADLSDGGNWSGLVVVGHGKYKEIAAAAAAAQLGVSQHAGLYLPSKIFCWVQHPSTQQRALLGTEMLCPAIQTLQRAAVCACRGTAEATTTETENETLNRISGNKTPQIRRRTAHSTLGQRV